MERVRAAEHSLRRMHSLLLSPLCGSWPSDRVTTVENRPTLGNLPHELVTWFQDANDVALFYYVGHGQYDNDDRLCLSLADSSPEAHLRTTSSLTFDAVRHAFKVSKATTKVAILDCCFAGLAPRDGNTLASQERLPGSPGFYLMMASGEYSTAWFERDDESSRPQTFFTKYLADVVENDIPGQPEALALRHIFDQTADALVRDGKPTPGQRISDHAASFTFARNIAGELSQLGAPHSGNDNRSENGAGTSARAGDEQLSVQRSTGAQARHEAPRDLAGRMGDEGNWFHRAVTGYPKKPPATGTLRFSKTASLLIAVAMYASLAIPTITEGAKQTSCPPPGGGCSNIHSVATLFAIANTPDHFQQLFAWPLLAGVLIAVVLIPLLPRIRWPRPRRLGYAVAAAPFLVTLISALDLLFQRGRLEGVVESDPSVQIDRPHLTAGITVFLAESVLLFGYYAWRERATRSQTIK